jgi:hypothetical protein
MSLTLLVMAQLAAGAGEGPDLAEVDRAVAKCDSGAMTKIFGKEPERRRTAMIAIFTEQQAIAAERRTLAQRRYEAMSNPAPAMPEAGPPTAPAPAPTPAANFELEKQLLADRQQALDDARMLAEMRDKALDTMRQQYLTTCNTGLARAGK